MNRLQKFVEQGRNGLGRTAYVLADRYLQLDGIVAIEIGAAGEVTVREAGRRSFGISLCV